MQFKVRKHYKDKVYYPAEACYNRISESVVDSHGHKYGLNRTDMTNIWSYRCCNCHSYILGDKFFVDGFIDEEFAHQNLYRCPKCKEINLILDYSINNTRRVNLQSNIHTLEEY